ncbi:hypothetical protein ACI1US_00100 [Leucobacter sp. BZR 635]
MSARVRAIIGVTLMSLLLVLYFVFAGMRAFALLRSSEPIAIVMGVALIVLPLLGVWALIREIMFGLRSTQLVDELGERGLHPEELVALDVTDRSELREAADAIFPQYKAAAEAEPQSWEAFLRLGLVYDAANDRKRARSAIRQAISLKHN